METPTSILVGGGILAAATYGLIFRGLNQAYKRAYKAETGKDRAPNGESGTGRSSTSKRATPC
jgi:hypothetical protein